MLKTSTSRTAANGRHHCLLSGRLRASARRRGSQFSISETETFELLDIMKKFWAKVFDYIIFMLVDACFKQIKNIYYWRGLVALMAQLSFIYRDFGKTPFSISTQPPIMMRRVRCPFGSKRRRFQFALDRLGCRRTNCKSLSLISRSGRIPATAS